jgi:hypothetical protein
MLGESMVGLQLLRRGITFRKPGWLFSSKSLSADTSSIGLNYQRHDFWGARQVAQERLNTLPW